MPDMIVTVDAPHFNAGLIMRDGICVYAAPILGWSVGKTTEELRDYFMAKGWKATKSAAATA